jgi:hypothetical protein
MFGREDSESLDRRLADLWENLGRKGIDRDLLLARSLLSPATCCLINPDVEETVEKAFVGIRELSGRLREKYKISK